MRGGRIHDTTMYEGRWEGVTRAREQVTEHRS